MEALRVLLGDRDAEIRDLRAALGGRDAELESFRAERDAEEGPSSRGGDDAAVLREEIHNLRALVDQLQSGARDESRAMCLSDVGGGGGGGEEGGGGGGGPEADEGLSCRKEGGGGSEWGEEGEEGVGGRGAATRRSRSERDAKAAAKRARVERGCMSALLER